MTLHVFNPEHDIALASGLVNFTAPHAGRQLRHDLGFLPALWAEPGDSVLVEDAELAITSLQRLAVAAKKYLGVTVGSEAVLHTGKRQLTGVSVVAPWGWDAALRGRLRRMGIDDELLPSDEQLSQIRELSHRRVAARLLGNLMQIKELKKLEELKEATECRSISEVEEVLARYPRAVMKAPWSSSGRGLRFVGSQNVSGDGQSLLTPALEGWVRGVLERQGSVMVEPYYNKVKDFGMEFEACADGSIKYCGLSLFHTANGAYTGNIVATEQWKREAMSRFLRPDVLDEVRENICHHLADILQGQYQGPLGVDMMVINNKQYTITNKQYTINNKQYTITNKQYTINNKQEGFLLHPCVEINLRRTMGHVALALSPEDDDLVGVMRITYANGCYRLNLGRVES